jgi:hypothetical protein
MRTQRIVAKYANTPYITIDDRTNATCFFNNCTCWVFFNFRILFISHGSCAMPGILSLLSATLRRQMNVFHLDYGTHCLAARRNCHHHILQKVQKINYLGSKTGVSAFKRVIELRIPEFLDNRRMNLTRLAAQRTGHHYPTVYNQATHFC